jgi:Uma2 family endonuclease
MNLSLNHSAIIMMLILEICKNKEYSAFPLLTLAIGGVLYSPDISVYKWRQIDVAKDKKAVIEVPDIVIEVIPESLWTQKFKQISQQKDLYLSSGVKSVWSVIPSTHTIDIWSKKHIKTCRKGKIKLFPGTYIDLSVIFDNQKIQGSYEQNEFMA